MWKRHSVKLEQLKAKWTYPWEQGIANQEQREMQARVRELESRYPITIDK